MTNGVVEVWQVLAGLLHVGLAAVVTVHAVLFKRDSRAAIAWVGLAWLTPLMGSLAYFVLGINRIQRKAVALRVREAWRHESGPSWSDADLVRVEDLARRFPNLLGLARVGRHLTQREVTPGNAVRILVNGDEAYPAMLAAIDRAQHSVALMSYIFDSDRAGDRFHDALVQARDRGVEVRVLVDDVGSRYSRPNMVGRLRRAQLKAAVFLPSRRPGFYHYANLRNHRKILVVDGVDGFTGGTNIREAHWLALRPRDPIQCVHFQVSGPVVTQMQEAFALDWAFATGESLQDHPWFVTPDRRGEVWARGISDGPDEDLEKLADAMIAAVTAATKKVTIVTPYFLPDAAVIRTLSVAALRGVAVRIYLPSVNNIPPVHWACMALLGMLLEKGCRVFLTPPPFDHSKLLIVDGVWSLIGSTNWDPRSLRLNFEYNVECYDEALAADLEALVERKAAAAREVTRETLDRRGWPVRLRDGLARLATPYL